MPRQSCQSTPDLALPFQPGPHHDNPAPPVLSGPRLSEPCLAAPFRRSASLLAAPATCPAEPILTVPLLPFRDRPFHSGPRPCSAIHSIHSCRSFPIRAFRSGPLLAAPIRSCPSCPYPASPYHASTFLSRSIPADPVPPTPIHAFRSCPFLAMPFLPFLRSSHLVDGPEHVGQLRQVCVLALQIVQALESFVQKRLARFRVSHDCPDASINARPFRGLR